MREKRRIERKSNELKNEREDFFIKVDFIKYIAHVHVYLHVSHAHT